MNFPEMDANKIDLKWFGGNQGVLLQNHYVTTGIAKVGGGISGQGHRGKLQDRVATACIRFQTSAMFLK